MNAGARIVVAFLFWLGAALARHPLLVISIDGLDNRYLRDCDKLALRIPNLRKLMAAGEVAEGVVGVVPTITWPSHTTIITGVPPGVHGIVSNRLPGGDYPWSAHLLKVRTLLDAAHQAGLRTATVTWPVTVDAPVDFNLPEYFHRRRGGAMDLRSIESKSVPANLVARISAQFPSFAQEWMDDRTRTQAVVYLLRNEKPDLTLVHLVDLDSEQHEDAPFSREAKAVLEYTDELVGQMLSARPPDMAVAVVSDHGFEEARATIDLQKIAADRQVEGLSAGNFTVTATTDSAAALLTQLAADPSNGIGRRIPALELQRFAPDLLKAKVVYESATGVMFAGNGKDIRSTPKEIGNHGHWPMRYRAVYLLSTPGIGPSRLPEIAITEVAGRLADVLELEFP